MSEKQFAGKSAIVTGATRGIGRAIALELAKRGANVAFNYSKSADEAERLKAEIESLGVKCFAAQCDVEVFRLVDCDGLTPLLALFNAATLAKGIESIEATRREQELLEERRRLQIADHRGD